MPRKKKSQKSAKKVGRKPAAAVKGEVIRLRLTAATKELALKLAADDGKDVSWWLRSVIVAQAREKGLLANESAVEET